ncbi:uncharacterized protein LOC131050621 isoform X3 [Cryptomeria japonica]|uniref:uncharacterized protein LOC131050621 isoform X3 n=1 Tax=Cryptomeria japonica TaxID=3369 RepID=UPI0025ACE165|nr:uncharacterized protein LOC131050621 isoform X3 [Cryptomeria japonica]
MWRSGLLKPLKNAASCNLFFQIQRGLHSRNKKAKEYIGKGWSAIQEVDRVIPYTEPDDELLIPLLKSAKQNFELALEVDNLNTQARLWLARLHLKYCVPGACKAVGAGLLVEAADMGNADAQYELFCQLRTGESSITKDRQAVYYLDKAINQLQPDALFVLGAMHLGGDCVKKDLELAAWCFQKATQKEVRKEIKRIRLEEDWSEYLKEKSYNRSKANKQGWEDSTTSIILITTTLSKLENVEYQEISLDIPS